MRAWLLTAPSLDDFVRLLRAWRFWVLGALVGALLGASAYAVFPPEYRARATVTVSFNAEKSWPNSSDNELFYYLDREARKLEEVAWSDATLQAVTQSVGGVTVSTLRSGKLQLSQPEDGAWHFYADDPQSGRAVQLAAAWAQAFVTQTRQGIDDAVQLDAARQALAAHPDDATLQAQVDDLEAHSLAITPELQVTYSQGKELPVGRTAGLGTYALAGALLFLALSALVILFSGERRA